MKLANVLQTAVAAAIETCADAIIIRNVAGAAAEDDLACRSPLVIKYVVLRVADRGAAGPADPRKRFGHRCGSDHLAADDIEIWVQFGDGGKPRICRKHDLCSGQVAPRSAQRCLWCRFDLENGTTLVNDDAPRHRELTKADCEFCGLHRAGLVLDDADIRCAGARDG